MNLIKFLEENNYNYQALTDQLGITVKQYEDRVVLNYSQIDSPKTHPVVVECRGIILDNEHNVICRPFDRFFNLGEAPNTQASLNMAKAITFEKVDGSLIKIYHHKNKWEIATRGTAFAESNCNGFDMSFRELVLKALQTDEQGFQERANMFLNKDVTYCAEVTSMENRVVTRYNGYQLHYLGARVTSTGEYVREQELENVLSFGAKNIKKYSFENNEQAIAAVNALGGLQEGFVVWQDGVPIAKIKADAYVAVHHIRGDGLTPKRISELVLSGEEEEYLTYFNEDRVHIQPYIDAFERLKVDIVSVWEDVQNIAKQKEFALAIKDKVFAPAIFTARKTKLDPVHCFNESRISWKIDILKGYVA